MQATTCRIAALALAVLASGAAAQAPAADPVPPDQLFERLAPSVWSVEVFDARQQPLPGGSAVVIGPGRLVTNCHVLARAQRVAVARDNVSYGATLEHPDPERDLCLLRVANFTAPAVTVAGAEGMKTGARVYAIASPRGQDQTIADGLLTALKRGAAGEVSALQVTVPMAAGGSGGGLFDARGRLVGITGSVARDGGNAHLAVPASWIADVPQRAAVAVAALPAKPAAAVQPAAASAPAGGYNVFEYALRDKVSRRVSKVIYRLDRIDGDRLVFNNGSRIEKPGGGVVAMTAPIGGDFDVAMPPGGWITGEPKPGATWDATYRSDLPGQVVAMRLRGRTLGESTMRLKDRELRIVQVEFAGYTERNSAAGSNPPGRYRATAWYAPELGRIVRFDAKTRGGVGGGAFYIDEQLELVDVRNE